MKNIYQMLNDIETQIPEENFTDIEKRKMKKSVHRIAERDNRKRKKKIVAAGCLLLAFTTVWWNQDVNAFMKNAATKVLTYMGLEKGYQTEKAVESGLKQPLVMTKNGITVTINQLVCSESEVFTDYSVEKENLRSKDFELGENGDDGVDIFFHYYSNGKNVTDKLFAQDLAAELDDDCTNPELRSEADTDTERVEFLRCAYGKGFLYEGKELDLKVTVVDNGEKTKFVFPVTIQKLFPEKQMDIEKNVVLNGNQIQFQKAVSTFTRLHISGTITNERLFNDQIEMEQIKIYDENNEELKSGSGQFGGKNMTFDLEYQRNDSHSDHYTVKIFNEDGKYMKQFDIK